MIVVVTGGRNYDGTGLVEKLNGINKLEKIELMVLGDATGADSIALNWAKINNIPYVVKKAEWRKFGRAAGPTRNSAMIELAKSHLITENKRVVCVVAPGGNGTLDCKNKAMNENFEIVEVE